MRLGGALLDEPSIPERAALLIELEDILHSEVPADLWVTTPGTRLGNGTLQALRLEGGLDGIRRVARFIYNLEWH